MAESETKTGINLNTAINSSEVAKVAASAAYPYEDTAHTLENYGFTDLAAEQFAKIDQASIDALTEWVKNAKHDATYKDGDWNEYRRIEGLVDGELHKFHPSKPEVDTDIETEQISSPELKGVGQDFAARVVGYMLTHDPEVPISATQMARDLGGENQAKVSRLIAQLNELGYILQEKALGGTNRPFIRLRPTERMVADAAHIPAWNSEVEWFELAKRFGMSDTEVKEMMKKIGHVMFLQSSTDKKLE